MFETDTGIVDNVEHHLAHHPDVVWALRVDNVFVGQLRKRYQGRVLRVVVVEKSAPLDVSEVTLQKNIMEQGGVAVTCTGHQDLGRQLSYRLQRLRARSVRQLQRDRQK